MYDLIVIGGGPGGYVGAIRGAQQGLKVLLIEKDTLGGTCLNRGCIPTKCFFYDSKLYKTAKKSPVLDGADSLSIDPVKMVGRKREVVKSLVSGLDKIIRSNGIEVVQGFGELAARDRVRVVKHDGSTESHNARNIILATGSRPTVPSFFKVDGHFVQTTDEALDTMKIPTKLVIIGGGVIGIEMAAIYLNLGSEVTIIEMLPDILITEDKEIRQAMMKMLKKRGVTVYLNANAKDITPQNEKVKVTFEDERGAVQNHKVNRVLLAAGRTPNMDGINISRLGLKMNGLFVKVNSHLETSLPGVYAIGDLVGGMMLAHKATAEADAAVKNMLGNKKEVNTRHIPRCIWGLTEIAAVGLTEEEAQRTGRRVKIGRFPYASSGAANALGIESGLVKIIGDAETGEILGVHIIGEHATDLIGDPLTTMTMESAVEDLAEAIKPHPTLSETIMEAAMDWKGAAIHSIKK